MAWVRSYLKFPGFVADDNRGVWVLTEAGRRAADRSLDWVRGEIRKAKAVRRTERLAARAASNMPEASDEEPDEDRVTWADQLLVALKAMNPAALSRHPRLEATSIVALDPARGRGDG